MWELTQGRAWGVDRAAYSLSLTGAAGRRSGSLEEAIVTP
jgi:hypothetical protein